MPFIGRTAERGKNTVLLDAISTSATATYNLTKDSTAYGPAGAASLVVSLNGVTQAPITGYTVSGTQLIFASPLASTDVIDYIISHESISTNVNLPDGTVTNSKLSTALATRITSLETATNTTLATRITALEDENILNLGVI